MEDMLQWADRHHEDPFEIDDYIVWLIESGQVPALEN